MKEVNFSDWQEMALKKDVEQIKKKIYYKRQRKD